MQGPFGGLTVYQVKPGTEIEDPDTGEKLAVDDDSVVTLQGNIYVTPKMFSEIEWRITAPTLNHSEG